MDKRQASRMAHAAGLRRLEAKHLTQLARGAESARELADQLPKDLHWSEEMALTFRLADARDKS
jgi:hypothetical protein